MPNPIWVDQVLTCDQSVTRIGHALKPMITVMENFDRQHQIPSELGNYTRQSSEKDLHKIIEQIFVKSKVFLASTF